MTFAFINWDGTQCFWQQIPLLQLKWYQHKQNTAVVLHVNHFQGYDYGISSQSYMQYVQPLHVSNSMPYKQQGNMLLHYTQSSLSIANLKIWPKVELILHSQMLSLLKDGYITHNLAGSRMHSLGCCGQTAQYLRMPASRTLNITTSAKKPLSTSHYLCIKTAI